MFYRAKFVTVKTRQILQLKLCDDKLAIISDTEDLNAKNNFDFGDYRWRLLCV